MEVITEGMVYDMYIEMENDKEQWDELATLEDIEKF